VLFRSADLKGDAKRKAVCKGHCVRRSGVRAAQEVQLFEVDIDCHLGGVPGALPIRNSIEINWI
jgi:hypothetical protein